MKHIGATTLVQPPIPPLPLPSLSLTSLPLEVDTARGPRVLSPEILKSYICDLDLVHSGGICTDLCPSALPIWRIKRFSPDFLLEFHLWIPQQDFRPNPSAMPHLLQILNTQMSVLHNALKKFPCSNS